MLPQKLFCPKCLCPDRDQAFADDLLIFADNIAKDSIILNRKHTKKEYKLTDILITYEDFKVHFKKRKMAMLHFSIKKEENPKEFYEVLFGEVIHMFYYNYEKNGNCNNHNNNNNDNQINNSSLYTYNNLDIRKNLNDKFSLIYILPSPFFKLLSIYSIYSLYYTQTSEKFYQINAVIEYIRDAETFILFLLDSGEKKLMEIAYVLYKMIGKLITDGAFSFGVISGVKSILLNKYGLPCEQKKNMYKCKKELKIFVDNFEKEKESSKTDTNEDILKNEYSLLKQNIIKNIKNLNFEKDDYIQFMNDKSKDNINNKNSFLKEEDFTLKKEDLDKDKITKLDFIMNKY